MPLEAQACGTPVLALGRGGATETVVPAGNDAPGTGLLFEEQTVEAVSGRSSSLRPRRSVSARCLRGARPSGSTRLGTNGN